ncbi:MAG: hypothetical protein HFF11_02780 [Angelakisella sp.]|jgi:hypothetical protein|nr:hypothetical protein [Angelakisella sp.]
MTTEVAEILEKIQQYIQQTPGSNNRNYSLNLTEWFSIREMDSDWESIVTAFDYGRAKGYRAARAEMKRKQQRRERSA